MIELKKLDFESDIEFNYRIEIGKILDNIGIINSNIEKELKDKSYNFNSEKGLNDKLFNRINKLTVPPRYIKANQFIIYSFIAMDDALKYLMQIKDDKKNIQKSYKYIQESILWIQLSNIYIFKSFENFDFSKDKSKN